MGDEIALTGSKVKQGEADLILAREVVKGTFALVGRSSRGTLLIFLGVKAQYLWRAV